MKKFNGFKKIFSELEEDRIRAKFYNTPPKSSVSLMARKLKVDRGTIDRAIRDSCERSANRFLNHEPPRMELMSYGA